MKVVSALDFLQDISELIWESFNFASANYSQIDFDVVENLGKAIRIREGTEANRSSAFGEWISMESERLKSSLDVVLGVGLSGSLAARLRSGIAAEVLDCSEGRLSEERYPQLFEIVCEDLLYLTLAAMTSGHGAKGQVTGMPLTIASAYSVGLFPVEFRDDKALVGRIFPR